MKIPFKDRAEVERLVIDYDNGSKDNLTREKKIEGELLQAKDRGYLKLPELQEIAKWKYSGGILLKRVSENKEQDLKEISAISFSTENENLRIGILRILHGVDWPMASVILHFAFPDKYPIFDVRAMKSVGCEPKYNFEIWEKYCKLCQDFCQKHGVTMRELDKALWMKDKISSKK